MAIVFTKADADTKYDSISPPAAGKKIWAVFNFKVIGSKYFSDRRILPQGGTTPVY